MIKVELNEQQWIAALNAMSLAPFREVQPLIAEMSRQIQGQQQAVEAAPVDAAPSRDSSDKEVRAAA